MHRGSMTIGRRTKFVLLALLSICVSIYCLGAFLLMSYNAGNNNDPAAFDRLAMAWVVGAGAAFCAAIASLVVAWRSKRPV
jgi:hypothetical protein